MPPAVAAVVGGVFTASTVYSSGIVLFGTELVAAGSWATSIVAGIAVVGVTFATDATVPGRFVRCR